VSKPVLAPEEIEALMARVAPDERRAALFASLPPLKQPARVEPIRLGDRPGDGPERYPMFLNIQERLLEALSEEWNALFKPDVVIKLAGHDVRPYRDIIAEDAARLYLVLMAGDYGRMMLTLDVPLVVAIVDAMLGGIGEAPAETTVLSAVERRLAERIGERMAHLLAEAWRPVQPLQFRSLRQDTNPQFLAVTNAADACFSTHFEISAGEAAFTMATHYPRPFLEPLLDKLKAAVSEETSELDAEWGRKLTSALALAPACLRVELGTCRLDIGRFLELAPGDVLPLSRRATDPSLVRVGRAPMFHARAGDRDGMLAIEILEPVSPGGQP